jgi:hypothetical protein
MLFLADQAWPFVMAGPTAYRFTASGPHGDAQRLSLLFEIGRATLLVGA